MMSREFTREAVTKFLPAQFPWIWCKCLLWNLTHSNIFNLTKYREVLVKYSLLITSFCFKAIIFRIPSCFCLSVIFAFPTFSNPYFTPHLDHFSPPSSAQCNQKCAICGLKIPSGQWSRSPSLTKRIAASGNEIGLCQISQNDIFHLKFSEFHLCFYSFCEIWYLFSGATMRNRLWCFYRLINYIYSPWKMQKRMRYCFNYSGTTFLSSKNWNYSISWWIPS